MNCDAQRPQVIDPQYTADYIPPKAIEDEDLPYGLSVRVEKKCRLLVSFAVWRRSVCMMFMALMNIVIQVKDLLDGRCRVKLTEGYYISNPDSLPTCRSRSD